MDEIKILVDEILENREIIRVCKSNMDAFMDHIVELYHLNVHKDKLIASLKEELSKNISKKNDLIDMVKKDNLETIEKLNSAIEALHPI